MTLKNLIPLTRPLQVMDIGAACIAEIPVYKPLLDENIAQLNAFEGDARQIDKIKEIYGHKAKVFREFLADGLEHSLYLANEHTGMTSLLKPDLKTLKFFNNFEIFGKIEKTEKVKTKRLDDVEGISKIDFLKMDIQGAELTVLKNGMQTLDECVAIQLEVSFICLYENQPTFGEVDVWMRLHGYVPHCFLDVKRWSIKPTLMDNNFRIPFNQLLEADIVYIRDPLNFKLLSESQLKNLFFISHYCFSSYDLCVFVILELIARKVLEGNTHLRYLELLGNKS